MLSGTIVLLVVAACHGPAETRPATNQDGSPAAAFVDPLAKAPRTQATGSGHYCVSLESEPAEVPVNELFELRLAVYPDASRTALAADVDVAVHADMPEHGHGMNTRPEVRRMPDGSFHVAGMLFHMLGFWEIYVDVRCGGITDRAVFAVEIE
jgi:hypothetical protein